MSLKISVITATFNSSATVIDTCRSVVEQTYPNAEHVIVDGLSVDDTLSIIRGIGHPNLLIDSRTDEGIYDALNRGINLASGDVLGFLHSDDFFPCSEVLANVAMVFEDPSIDLCFGDLAYVSRTDKTKVVRRWRAGCFKPSKLRFGWMPPHPTVYVRRELLQKYLFDLDFRISGDYDALLRLLSASSIKAVYIPREIVHMRLGGASNKSISNIWKKTREDWYAIRSNNVGGFLTLIFKNIRKFPQFFLLKR